MRPWSPRAGRSLGLCALLLLAAGRSDAQGQADDASARRSVLATLALAPDRLDAWGDLARLDEKDPESLALACLDASAACADLTPTRFHLSKTWPAVAEDEVAAAAKLALLRVAAVKAVQAALGKLRGPEDAATLLHLQGMAAALEDGAPGLAAGREEALAKARQRVVPEKKTVLSALGRVTQAALGKDDLATALAAARIVRGISQQDGQTTTTPAPPTDALRRAIEVIENVRAQLRAKETAPASRKVWTLGELELVPDEDVPAWNEKHRTWAEPGVAMSPGGLYRVETTCGLKTLQAVASAAELQHARLVRWFGSDPTKGVAPGLIRVCPDDADLESEGAFYWWLRGFQSGDVTTMLARYPTEAELAQTLVHELTHRFDGRAFEGLPAWLLEGRAVFTAAGSLAPDSGVVEERATLWSRLWDAGAKGYGAKDGLEKLLRGTTPEYRDNYSAGYALWLFLTRFQGFDAQQTAPRPYASRVQAYIESFRASPRTEPVARFTQSFCDGQDGRAKDSAAFCEQFGRYLSEGGSGALPPAPWKVAWQAREAAAWRQMKTGGSFFGRIYDRPTWTTLRVRHDVPDAGEAHAHAAAELLSAQGEKTAALDAFRWALLADEPDAARFARAAKAEEAVGDPSAAWFDRAVAHRMAPSRFPPPKGAPDGPTQGAWLAARELSDALGLRAAAAKTAGRARLAGALRGEQERVAEWTSVPVPEEPAAAPAKASLPPRVPELLPARSVLTGGVVAERWAPGDARPGPWHLPTPDAIELGLDKAAAARSDALRDAQDRRLFVRGREWWSGTYTHHVRVRFLSVYARASIVVGQTHRDRGVEITLEGGDWSYAVGNSAVSTPLRSLAVSLDERRPWAAAMTPLEAQIDFDQPTQVFDVTVHVAGPYVRVLVNGRETLSHRVATGMPVEGRIGFGVTTGIVRFEEPEVRRHRVTGPDRVSPEEAFDAPLSLSRDTSFPWSTVAGRRVEGLPPTPAGLLLLWYPSGTAPEEYSSKRVSDFVEYTRGQLVDWAPILATVHAGSMPAAAGIDAVTGTLRFLPPGLLPNQGCAAAEKALADHEALKRQGRAPSALPSSPLWIAVDRDGVIRSAGPSMRIVPAREMFRVLAGRRGRW